MHLFFLVYFSNHPLHVSNRLTIHRPDGSFTVSAAYGIYYSTLMVLAASECR